MKRDIFICHASEDKEAIAKPIAIALNSAGIECWLDEAEIHWGDSIPEKVNEGLAKAQFVLVILSEWFVKKKWPLRELNAVLNDEASTGTVKVLPLIVGDADIRERILNQFPLISDKSYVTWEGAADKIVSALNKRMSRGDTFAVQPLEANSESVYLPRIKKRITDRERDRFLDSAFAAVRDYFKRAISELNREHPNVEGEVSDIHKQKFVCKIYVDGDTRCQCKIWVGGLTKSDSIAYSVGDIGMEQDNSFNEILNVVDDGQELYLSASLSFGEPFEKGTPVEAAESLWRRFCSGLETYT